MIIQIRNKLADVRDVVSITISIISYRIGSLNVS